MSYSPPTYTPTTYVENFNKVPRFVGSNEFETTEDYAIGVAATGAPFVLIGVLILIITPLALICGCCRKFCCKPKDKEKKTRVSKRRRIFYFVFLCIAVGGCAIAYAGLGTSKDAADLIQQSIGDISDLFSAASASTSQMSSYASAASTDVTDIETECPALASGDTTDIKNSLDELVSQLDELTDLVGDVNGDIDDFENDFENYDNKRITVTIIVLACATGLVGAYFLSCLIAMVFEKKTGCCGKCCSCCSITLGRLIMPITYIIVVVVWILVGVMFAITVGLSDFCIDPNGFIMAELGTSDTSTSISYYLTCNGTNPMYDAIDEARTAGTDALADIGDLRTAASAACPASTVVQDEIDSLEANLNSLLSELTVIEDDVISCEAVNSIYVTFMYDGMCDKVTQSMVLWFVGFLMLVLGLTVALFMYNSTAKPNRRQQVVPEDAYYPKPQQQYYHAGV
eukprot:Clim_evm57s148 gene=Clim_evmTU57s148